MSSVDHPRTVRFSPPRARNRSLRLWAPAKKSTASKHLAGSLQLANGDQVAVSDGTNVTGVERNERLRLPGCQHEFYFQTIGGVHVHHRTKVSTTQAILRQVTIKNNCVEQIEHELARKRSDEMGEVSPVGDQPDRHDSCLTT